MRFTTELVKKAWAIRRQAAAKFGVKIMSVIWRECLKMARGVAKLQRLAAWLANQDAAWANRVFSQDIGTRFDGSMFFNEGAVMYRAQMYGFSA